MFFSYMPPDLNAGSGKLICYDGATSEELWSLSYERSVYVADREFRHFGNGFIRWVETPGASYLLVAVNEARYYPARVLLLEPRTGEVLGEYLHPGRIYDVLVSDLDSDGHEEFVIGGANNAEQGLGRAGLAVLPVPFRNTGAKGHFFGREFSFERFYLLFPNIDVDLATRRSTGIARLAAHPKGLEVLLGGDLATAHKVTILIDPEGRVIGSWPSDPFLGEHDGARREGVLDHAYDPCELELFSRALRFETAVDSNSPEIQRLFEFERRGCASPDPEAAVLGQRNTRNDLP